MDIPERTIRISSTFLKGKLIRQDITAPSESDVNSVKIAGQFHSLFTDELRKQWDVSSNHHSQRGVANIVQATDPSDLPFLQRRALFENKSYTSQTIIQSFDSQLEPSQPTQNRQTSWSPFENEKEAISKTSIQFRPCLVPARVFDTSKDRIATLKKGRINQRQHYFSQRTIIKPDNCLACGNRIKFGKPALKCIECRGKCHIHCKSRMPMPCVPIVQIPSNKGFVGTVADYAPNTSPMIPALVIHCVNEIERRGLNEVSIYRVNGSGNNIKDMKERLLRGKGRTQLQQVGLNIHVVTGTLKLFLRSLKEPLITYELRNSFVRIADLNDDSDVQTTVHSLIPDLPQPNRDTLAYMILHLQRVAEVPACKMPVSNIATMFGPLIIGYSCPEPSPELALKQSKKQHSTMEKLLLISSDYWSRFVDPAMLRDY